MTSTLTYNLPGLELSVEDNSPLVASGMISEDLNFPIAPPQAWFDKQALSTATPVKITEDGQMFGHVAVFGVDHIGYDKVSRQAPRSACDYAFFKQGEVLTAEGGTVQTGVITAGLSHAGAHEDAVEAATHYDNITYGLADVAIYEDEIGIQIAGALRPDVTLAQARALRASNFSPDWRPVKQKGRFSKKLEMVALMACNLSGLLVHSLVASGALAEADDSSLLIKPGNECVVLDEDGDAKIICGTMWSLEPEAQEEIDRIQMLEDRIEYLETALRRVLLEEAIAEAMA